MKPTNLLEITVLIISLLIALAVAGTAIGLIWSAAFTAKEQEIYDTAEIIRSSLEFFSYNAAQQQWVLCYSLYICVCPLLLLYIFIPLF